MYQFSSWLGLILVVLSLSSRADFVIDIVGGADDATPIAVVPFGGAAIDDNPGNIINNDLKNSGVFKTLPPTSFPAQPTSSAEVFFHDWQHIGSDYLVVGNTVTSPLGLYSMHYELLSISSHKRIMGETLTLNAQQWRDAAHQIADHIYQKITGVRGAFATRILYVDRYYTPHGSMHFNLMVADSDGHRAQVVLDSTQPIMSPAWSPDAQKIAYVSFEDGRSAVFVQDLRTRARERVAFFEGINGAPAWAPDGKNLAMTLSRSGHAEIYLMNLENRSFRQLTNNPSINTEACWFPDGKSIAFTSDRGGGPQIYRLDLSSGQTTRLTFDGNYNARCTISPDGKKMAVVHRQSGQIFQIAIQDLVSGDMTILTQSQLDESPSFAPNGNMLVYATRYQNQGIMAQVSPDGRVKVLLPERRGEIHAPAW
ncbi:MAG: Tol-Pal system beta propeller repeat protein TolB, partial [Pseudomonadales bacterium]|nr:Tol-Pal system beta propeller repeat protein TolB [Pseudomonadales bacterium]